MYRRLAYLPLALLASAALASGASAHLRVRLLASYPAYVPVVHGLTLVGTNGQPVGGKWQQWVDQSRVSTYAGRLLFVPNNDACALATACSSGPMQGLPFETFVSSADPLARYDLYFEIGHQFDWRYLNTTDRRYLARAWGVPRAKWWTSITAIERGTEDGLEAAFAAIYEDCALGQSDEGVALGFSGGLVPPVDPKIDTCAFINRIAIRSLSRR